MFCAGIATRPGCGAKCPQVGFGCRGCYGPNEGVLDHGAKILTGIASWLDAMTDEEAEAIFDTLPDPAGTSTASICLIPASPQQAATAQTPAGW